MTEPKIPTQYFDTSLANDIVRVKATEALPQFGFKRDHFWDRGML